MNTCPFKIPSNEQNMIMRNYAARNNLAVDLIISESMMSKEFATTLWPHKEKGSVK